MSSALFRKEVLESKQLNWLGGVSLSQPLKIWVLVGLMTTSTLLIVCFLFVGEYTRRSRVTGQLVPDLGLSVIVSPTDGVVGRLFPNEGDRVNADDALSVINVPRVTTEGNDTLSIVRTGLDRRQESIQQLGRSQSSRTEAQILGVIRQRDLAAKELDQITKEIETRREQVRIGRETEDRFKQVADDKYVSQLQVNQQQQAVLEFLNMQQLLERQSLSIRRNLTQLEQELQELQAQKSGILAATSGDLAKLDQERVQEEANGQLSIRAPLDGMVANRLIEPGQAVTAGQPILSLLPQGSQLQAQLFVPSSAVGFIEPGDRVLLRYQAFPYQKFGHHGGSIIRVSYSSILPSKNGKDDGEPYYRVIVALDTQTVTAYGKSEPLRPGMKLDADILGERRKLYEWALEPLFSLRGKLVE